MNGGLWGKNLTVHDLTEKHYTACIKELQLGLKQLQSMNRGEHQHCCGVCGDNDHTAEQCWLHNPLLAAALGWDALAGPFWRCFHCNAVFTTEESAEKHFGKTPESIPECLQQLAELADEEARRFEVVDGLVEPK